MSETTIITLVLLAGAVILGIAVARRARLEKPEGYDAFKKSSSSKSDVSVEALLTLVRGGQKIEAIKRYREQTGLGLKESKDAIDGLEASGNLPLLNKAVSAASAGTMPEVEQLIRRGNQIEAIKRYRDLTGAGLKESKDAVDALAKTLS